MRFELIAAYAMGAGLPLLETLRRRTNFDTISGYVDDFIVGGLLLYAASAVSRGKRGGPILLVAAWGILCGGLYGSFFYQLESSSEYDVSGLPNATVALIKGALYVVGVTGLVLSIRSAMPRRDRA